VPTILQIFALGAESLPGILTFRLLPFVGVAVLSREYSWRTRVIVPALYAPVAVLAAKHGATPFYWLVLAYVYFAAAGWVAYEILPSVRSKAVWFGVVTMLFWVLPTAVMHPLPRTFLLLGWDCVLGAYSYGVDTRDGPDRCIRDFLFFLLVNPALVYRQRGTRLQARSIDVGALARVSLGVCAVLLSICGAFEFCRAVLVGRFAALGLDAAGVAGTLVLGASYLGREYAVQSGVASLQIGCMLQLGYRVPERYRYPLFAHSPGEFWRRWNTYVGGWAQAYVFVPLAAALRRSSQRPGTTRMAYAGAVVLTFGVVGLFHDVFVLTNERRWSGHATNWFLAMGCLVAIWELVVRKARHGASGRGGRRIVEQSVFVLAACFAAAHWR
jgi:hypothetical protein